MCGAAEAAPTLGVRAQKCLLPFHFQPLAKIDVRLSLNYTTRIQHGALDGCARLAPRCFGVVCFVCLDGVYAASFNVQTDNRPDLRHVTLELACAMKAATLSGPGRGGTKRPPATNSQIVSSAAERSATGSSSEHTTQPHPTTHPPPGALGPRNAQPARSRSTQPPHERRRRLARTLQRTAQGRAACKDAGRIRDAVHDARCQGRPGDQHTRGERVAAPQPRVLTAHVNGLMRGRHARRAAMPPMEQHRARAHRKALA
eukprot:365052-Chlamydomonas_euryale.AAC.4